MARMRRRTVVRSQKRNLIWARSIGIFDGLTAGAPQTVDLLSNLETVKGGQLIGIIIRRFILNVSWVIVTAGARHDLAVAALVQTEGLGALDPIASRYGDYMFYDWRGFNGDPALDVYTFSFDIKSGRKLDEVGQEFVLHAVAGDAGATYNVQVTVNTLVALP